MNNRLSTIPAYLASTVVLGAALTACGGGSSDTDASPAKDGAVTALCPTSTSGSYTYVIAQGCLGELSGQIHTMACRSSTLYMLSGNNWTLQELMTQGSTVNAAGGVTIQGHPIKCI